ncbi:MAG: Meiotic Sister-Chromatid recombination aldehyde dehydrogenase [Heterodermia speciosa]|uniref:aldehyde dehydrogenase (NAD(+)) n=1 Tax=Heterodermia speciosa TaxID=116794 RepID=A0A8H3EXI3_9LECA|nr:MAG: Meiotic Sister-Chromatid recombination aldehyde dehydrogenase [Heterodermia speciosa]
MEASHTTFHGINNGPVTTQSLVVLFAVVLISSAICYSLFVTDHEAPIECFIPVPEQCLPTWNGRVLDTPDIKIAGSSAIQCYCPADGRLLGLVNPATSDGIDRAIARAKEAQVDWAKTTFGKRKKVLRTLLKFILDNQDTIATVACLDSGKTKIDAILGEILVTVEKLKWTIKHGEKALRPEKRPTNFLMMYKSNEVRWEPLGVVAACVSWNYPFHNFMGPIISSIFTGSAIVVKASEQTAWSLTYFTSLARTALTSCDHSPHLIQSLVCWPSAASHLTSHPSISHLTFIGSRPVAHSVCASAAKSLTPVCVELGGKDAALILDDISLPELRKIASILMRGVFQSSGQNCVGIERIICLPTSYTHLISLLEPRIRALRLGNSLAHPDEVDVGAMISSSSFSRLESLVSDAVSQGARCLVGGTRYSHPHYPKGHYFSPTLLADVTPSMAVAREELFAPICLLMRAQSLTSAISIGNSTPYALGSSVFGTKISDLDRCVDELNAGMVAVNDFAVFYAVQLPFGGVKGSGYGRFAGEEGLRGICNVKSVCRDRWTGVWGWGAVKTRIPAALDYPMRQGARAWGFARGVVELGYAEGWRRRGRAVLDVVRYS